MYNERRKYSESIIKDCQGNIKRLEGQIQVLFDDAAALGREASQFRALVNAETAVIKALDALGADSPATEPQDDDEENRHKGSLGLLSGQYHYHAKDDVPEPQDSETPTKCGIRFFHPTMGYRLCTLPNLHDGECDEPLYCIRIGCGQPRGHDGDCAPLVASSR